jgi:hypothetical protein
LRNPDNETCPSKDNVLDGGSTSDPTKEDPIYPTKEEYYETFVKKYEDLPQETMDELALKAE